MAASTEEARRLASDRVLAALRSGSQPAPDDVMICDTVALTLAQASAAEAAWEFSKADRLRLRAGRRAGE